MSSKLFSCEIASIFSIFYCALLRIFFAFYPNLRVEWDYSSCYELGVMHSTIAVLEFPPSDAFRILVSGLFL
jgi:hypothetical protein